MSKPNVNSVLSQELKGWIDNVVVPALVREYLAGREHEKLACSRVEGVAECATSRTVPSREGG